MTPQADADVLARAAGVRLVIFDVDGVLTDGSLYMDGQGNEYKAFNSRDGHGLRMLQDSGVAAAIITGRQSDVVAHRAAELGFAHVYQGRREKGPAYAELRAATGLADAAIAFMKAT